MEQKNILNEMKAFQKDMLTKPDKNCNCMYTRGGFISMYGKTSTVL